VPAPAAGKVSPGKVVLDDGRIVVFAVSRVIPGDPREATAEQRATLQRQLGQMAGDDDARALVKSLRKRMKITVAENRL
jgi:peptidyl-prolyl cis-trans isomerase D